MRKNLIRRLAFILVLGAIGLIADAQTITIDNTNFSTASYGAGGGITVPIQLSGGCFNQANTFQLYLSDAAGNFPGTLIGTYNSFFTPFVNGIIPAGTAPGGNYRVRVVSTSPAGPVATSNPFTIVATATTPVTNPTTSPTNTINDSTFGRCLIISNATLNLGVSVPGGKTLVAKVLDSLGNNVAATVGATSISFTMVVGNYYTVQLTIRNADNSISIKSFLVLASTSNLSLQTAGSNEICLPDTKEYTINTTAAGGIKNNYPGTIYTINWGDGNTTTYTHCQLMTINGAVDHEYTQTSCGQPAITDITPNQYNAFRVSVTASNQFCSNSFTPISSFAKVWERPEANFINPTYGCLNTNITFTNTSQVGLSGNNNAVNCTNSTLYEWYVDGSFASSATNLVHSFSTPGMHSVQLVALNDPCSDDTTMYICIEEVPVPDFSMNGQASLAGCAPLVVTIANLTNTSSCRPFNWNWQVLLSPSLAPATLGVHYTITPSATDSIPQITFLEPGNYIIRLTISNSCGTFTRDRTVSLLLDADVNLPGNQQYCGLQTLNFLTSPGHVTTYNVNTGTLAYQWTFTPGTVTFVGGTDANSRYPQVQFNAYGTYNVKVRFTNDCGIDSATQQILFYQPVTVNAGTDEAVCFSTASVNLNGSSSGPAGYTAVWSIQPGFGTGSISNPNISNPAYTFSGTDKSNGTVRLIYTATPPAGSVCPVVRDTVQIIIHPDNNITSAATRTVCSGSNLNYTITSSVPSSTFSWTSSVISGSATGNTAAGTSATINDALTNPSASVDAVVRYVITPIANGCNGNAFNLDVTVKPIPDFTPAPSAPILCSGEQLTISLTSSLVGAQYTWSSSIAGGTLTGNSNQASPSTTISIVNTLTNTGTTDVTVTYTIVVYNPGSPVCTGESEQVIVTVRPPVNASASSNSPICSGQTINLTGNSTTAGATFSWTGPNGFTSNAQNPTISNGIPANAGVYTLITTAGGCPSPATNTTVVVNTAPVIGGGSGTNPTSCASATGFITLTGLANNTTYTANYTFNGNPATPVSLTSNGSGEVVIPNLAAGVYDNITVTLGTCPSNAFGPVTLADPTAPNTPTVGSNSPICAGNTLTLNANTTSPGVATYTWSGPNGFTSNTQNPSISNATTAATGTYNVTVTIANCTSAAGTVSVVVNTTPVAPTAGNNGPLCTSATLNLVANTSTAGVTYAWTGPNGFNSGVQNPSVSNVTIADAGVYSVIATLGSCASVAGTTTVIVNPTPNISGTTSTDPTNCATPSGSITLNGLTNNTTYTVNYTFNGNPATPATIASNGTGSLVIPNLLAGIYANLTVTLNGCISNTVGPVTLVDPTPPATPVAGSNSPICSGNTLALSANTTSPGTATWSWSGPSGFTSTSQTPSITNVTLAAAGTYSVTVTINGCTSAAGTTTPVINETPVIPIAGSNSPVCSGNPLNLTANTTTGGATYAWTGPNAFSSSVQNPSIATATTAAAGTYSVTATLGSCTSSAGTTVVAVNPTPNISGSSTVNPTTCATSTGSITLDGLNASTIYTVRYTQNGNPVNVSLSSNAGGSITITNLPAGSYTSIFVELNNCPSNTVGPFTLSDPTPPSVPVTGSNSPICSGNTLLLTANSATPGVTYAWSGPNGFNSTTQNPSITNALVAATGTYSVTATLNGCTSGAGTVNVTVNATPVTPTAGSNSPVCSGGTINLTASTPSAGVTYAWTGPNGFSNALQNPTISNATTAEGGTYNVIATATVGNCPSAPGSTVVVVNPTANINGTANNPTNCATTTGSITLTGLVPSTSYTVNYTQGATPQTATLSSDAGGTLVIPNLAAGTYTNISVALNNCPSNVIGPFTLVDPTPPATPTAGSNGPVCSGNTLNLTASTTSPGTASYAWSGPNGFVSTDQNPSITNVTTAATGTYTVAVTINSCTSAAGTVNVVVHQTPAMPVAGSNSPVCSDSTLNLTASTASAGTMTWSWTGPNGFNSISQNPSIPNITMAANGIYTVIATATTGNCPSATGSTTVVINPTPVITTTSFTNPTQCTTPTGSITLNGLAASTLYLVQYNFNGNPQSVSITSNAGGSVLINNLVAGTYTNIRVTLTGCPSNVIASITLTDPNPPATPTAGSNGPICSGNTLNLTSATSSVGAIIYTWSGPNGFSSTQQNPSIPGAIMAANGVYSVTATLDGCVSAAGTVNVTINETPATPVAGNNGPICADSTLLLTATTTFGGTVSWSWTGPNGFANSAQNPSIVGATTAANGLYNVVATAFTGNCPSAAGTTTVVVNPTPVIINPSFTNPTGCLTATGSIILNGLSASTAYTVTYTRDGTPVSTTITSDGSGVLTIPGLTAGTYASIRVATLVGCPSNTVGPFILADPNPPATPTAGSNSPICNGETLLLTANTTTPGAIVYTWTGPAGFTSNLQNPTIVNASAVNTGTYFVTATLNNCVSPQASVPVTVTALPAAPAVTSPVNYCIDALSVPLTATPAPGNSLRWYTSATGGTPDLNAPVPSTSAVGVTNYYVSQATPLGCEGTRALIEVFVNPDALAEYVYAPFEDCAPFNIDNSVIQPVLYPTRNGVYEWYANGVLIGTGTTFPGYTIVAPGDSVYIKMKAISLFGCKNDSAERWFYTIPKPVTDFDASDTVGCGPLSVTFTNTTPLIDKFSYNWNFGNGIISSAQNPGTIIFQPNPTAGDTVYHVSLAAFTQCDTIIKVVDIRVRSKPKAIITPNITYGCSPLTVVFNNISLGANMTYQWNFGDGSAPFFTNNTLPVQHTYNTAQQDTFDVRLIATNDCGSDTGRYNVVVAARTIELDVAVNGNEKTGCAPHTVNFYNNSTGATNFVWDFGDGNLLSTTNNIDTIQHTYLTVGTFNVSIQASNGCTDTTITETISVFAKPLVNFTVMPVPICVGDTLFFTNQSDTITGLLWNFDDGITSQLTNPTHAYTTPGTYDVKLIGIRQYGPGNACTDSIIKQVTVVASLPGSFSVSDSVSTCVPFNVTFTNHSLPSSLTTWNFGDGNVDTGDIVTHTFTQVGTFTVTMTARDINGCTYSATKQIVTAGPNGSFTYDNGYICGDRPVRFEAVVTGTDSIRWNFGDGTILSTTAHIVYHVYSQPGIYVPTAQLIAAPGGTCRRTLQGPDTIRVEYVSAGFVYSQVKTCGTTTVAFTDTSRSYFGLNGWQWNFGDGNNSTVRHPVHVYTSTNTWPIQLIAQGVSGCADTVNIPVFVKVDSKPIVSIVSDNTGCVNQPVTYNSVVTSNDPVTYYNWTFSNGATGNSPTVINNYGSAGTFNGQLIVGTAFGCYDTTSKPITINPSPTVNTNPNMQICRGQSAQLNATGAFTYDWAPFTGLSCTTCPNPIASPVTTTQYVVTGYNGFGCAGRDTILITVPQPIDVIAGPDAVMCIGQTRQLNATGATTYVWSPATGLSATNIPNPVASPTFTTIYRVIGYDAHNCFQDTAYVTIGVGNYPTVNAGTDHTVATGTLVNLAPTVTNGPIALWTWSPSNDLSCANCPTPVATAKKDICYNVTATNFFGCSGSDSVCIKVFCESSQVFIPNAFTPDGDGINDILTVRAKGVKSIKSFRVFNRWGQLVFEKANFTPNIDSQGWDGKVKGIPAPPDVYVYTCEVVCENDIPYTYKGNVAIIK
ncbi:MAG: cell surface protein [Chitinophagaceae bacterium]|nr:cell surface protein [Chitinophagaceae bacterium]